MISQIKLPLKALILFSLAFIIAQNAFGQKGNLTIKGNIKLIKLLEIDLDECCFHYSDPLSDKAVVVPIRRDSAGNFVVSMQLEHYQQIYFSKAININGQEMYNTGTIEFSFFGKPGQTMQLTFTQNPFKLKFNGDFAVENNQYQNYVWAQQSGVKNLYDGIIDNKLTSRQIKEKTLKSFKDQLTFNKKYFKTHPASAFIKQQAYYNALYETQNAAIQFNFIANNKVTEAMVADLYKDMNVTDPPFKDGPTDNMSTIFDPNPSLKNAAALGNSDYKSFLSSYFSVLDRNIKFDSVETVLSKDIAAYIIHKYPDLKEADKVILTKFLDDKAQHTAAENETMQSISNQYVGEFLQIRSNKTELAQYLAIKDPALRDLCATISLYKKLDFNHIESIEPVLDDYKKGVKNTYLKNKFLAAYTEGMNKLHHSKFSPLAVFNSSDGLKGPELLNKLLEKYKGKVVYVDAWATWCGPCIAGMEPSQKLREKLKGKDVVFVYLCLDSPNQTGWKNIIAAKSIEGENYFFDQSQSTMISRALNIKGIPHYALVDKNGNIVEKSASAPHEPETLKQINGLLVN